MQREIAVLSCLATLNFMLVIGNIFCYSSSTLVSRAILLVTFSALLVTLVASEIYLKLWTKARIIPITLLLSSLFFAIWRSFFFTPRFTEQIFNSETTILSQQYASNGHLVFDTAHSYFFLRPILMHSLSKICGFSIVTSFYLSLAIFCILTSLVGIMIYKALAKHLPEKHQKNSLLNILDSLVAFSVISFEFSERSGMATNLSLMLTLITLYFLVLKRFEERRQTIVLLVLIVGITIGDVNGILLLIPFFFFYAIFSRKTYLAYTLIPLTYLIFSAYSYTLSLKRYAVFAINGVVEFIEEIVVGQLPERIIPWQRVSHRMYIDTLLSSIAYLSIFAISLMVTITWMRMRIRTQSKMVKNKDSCSSAGMITLLLWFFIAGTSYVGASFKPETLFSDIRTIAIVLLSLSLIFPLTSKKLISCLSSKKVFQYCLIALIVTASLSTISAVYPKSVYDPIYVVEDWRLGLTRTVAAADFLNIYYEHGRIVGDYATLSRIGRLIPSYKKQFISEATLNDLYAYPPYRSILIINVAGVTYPSIYHSKEVYMAAYNFSVSHNRLYDNGIVVVASLENGNP